MASAEGISVAVERAVHDGLRDFAERLWREHGIRIESAHFDWIDVSSAGQSDMMLMGVSAETTTKAGR